MKPKIFNGLLLTANNYDIALNTLKEQYGNTEATIRALHGKLSNLKQCQNFVDCKIFVINLEQICRQLQALNQDIESLINF